MRQPSVLGRYAAIVAAIVVVGVIASASFARLIGRPDPLLDTLALTAFGLIVGTAGSLTQLNGTVRRTEEQDEEIRQLRAELGRIKETGR